MTERDNRAQKPATFTCGPTVADSLAWATTRLRENTEPARLEAEVLLAHTMDCTRDHLFAHPDQPLLPQQLQTYHHIVNRRALGEPLPYLTGHVEFFGLDFVVDARVLIPRPETETLVELALSLLRDGIGHPHEPDRRPASISAPVLADVGTGSGCIAVSIAVHAPHTRIYAIDVSADALDLARANAERHNVSERITFLESDLLSDVPEPIDLVVSNPPYIALGDWASLPREIREHEPRLALAGGHDGFDVIRRLLSQAAIRIRPGGAVLIEIGARQGQTSIHLAHHVFPDAAIEIKADLAGHDRVLFVRTREAHSPRAERSKNHGV
jgi:release factor glutamine methyltransferase